MESAPPGIFFRPGDFPGADEEVGTALRGLAAAGTLVELARGLFWRGKHTRFGMTHPSRLEVALAVAGRGSGPAGTTAAHFLGLTTQVPSMVEVAVPGPPPEPLDGVVFRSRPRSRRVRGLSSLEVAVLEVLDDRWAAEVSWQLVESQIAELMAVGLVRPDVLAEEVRSSRSGCSVESLMRCAPTA